MNTKAKPFGILHCMILAAVWIGIVTSGADCLRANVIPISATAVDSTSTTGVSFGYVGTLTQNDSIELTVSGDPCLQPVAVYCVNGAGVVIVPGTLGVGDASTFSGTFGGTTGTWDFGALLMEISGISGTSTVQIFPADAADGLGSGSPPSSLTLPVTTLSALGFSSFSEVNPTITFILADNLYTDNVGQFNLSQNLSSVPEPTTTGVVGVLVCVMAGVVRRRRAARNTP
ncbi:MAG TPA: PEP-CTERM sorting domain-containing protein [Bryobacteraceae bacterium]|nr:PEP-CTERM sorting domain-containing protein [Bryobacteraceae bacterium]